ncbi:M10 family metallopeptidase [Microvirga subterranea]|uniref:Hemolysin type calcium-binding protein n=1 Tax=Microvirga subterranea TaxID=186651 RepID=A0A370HS90_9HYPH|nr:M10 family metallopeptidase [Microvirga subterranea]RDI61185.1 hemolysin type calcium-binding protein [Microvirga subterranea]
MVGAVPVARTGDQNVDGLLVGTRWNAEFLSYSFPTSGSLYGKSYGWGEAEDGFEAFNPGQMAAVRAAFRMVAAVSNLNFSEVAETSGDHALLRFAMSDAPGSAWTYSPDSSEESGDTWFRNAGGWYDTPVPGNYAFYTVLHEMVHGIGLKHGHEAAGFGAMLPDRDSMEYSITTYRSYVGASAAHVENEAVGYAQTLMMYDIAALQHLYGANYAQRSGNTIYRWSPTTGETFIDGAGQGAPAGNRLFMTVWDGGGNDCYDFSNYETGVQVDLRPGEWSKTSSGQLAYLGGGQYARGSIANALLHEGDARSLIENAIGGRGADQITGNESANSLSGREGADRLFGLDGSDILSGGAGNDRLAGGAGRDRFVFDMRPSKTSNRDHISDFVVADDTIVLQNAVFTKLGKVGKLSSGAFWAGTAAHDASDRIIYSKGAGSLFYDSDGSGRSAPVLFATIGKNLKLTHADFLVI